MTTTCSITTGQAYRLFAGVSAWSQKPAGNETHTLGMPAEDTLPRL